MNVRIRSVAALFGAVALVVTVAACGSQESEPAAAGSPSSAAEGMAESPASGEAHNDADIEFAQMMAVHHEGAIVMADLAVTKGSTPEVKALGERISAAQGPEIDEMHALLQGWGAPIAGNDSMEGMDMGGADQDAAMTELAAATGADFDRSFLQLMIEHHRSALTMAETELAEGESPQALELAQTIIDAQETEIAEMEQLLQSL